MSRSLTTQELGWISVSGIVAGGLVMNFVSSMVGSIIQIFLGMLFGAFWFAQAIVRNKGGKNKAIVVLKLVAGVILMAVVNSLGGSAS